jgi:hypothetical protein
MPIPLYELIFDDYTRYQGGTIESPKWRESPEKPILIFKLRLPTGDFLLIQGYEAYNFFVEAVDVVYGNAGQESHRLNYMFLMGKKEGKVISYRINLDKIGSPVGDLTVRIFEFGKEYDGKPTSGWRGSKTED